MIFLVLQNFKTPKQEMQNFQKRKEKGGWVGGRNRRLELTDKNQIPACGGGSEVSAYLKSVGSRDCATVTVTSLPFSS